MAARAHDVAALSVKGNSATLNFPELKDLLPRPASGSPRDVQAAAAKAATMQEFSSDSYTSAGPPPSDEHALVNPGDELDEIIELPSLEGLDSSESLVVDSVDIGWIYPSWDVSGIDGFPGNFSDEAGEGSCLQTLL
ncbi:hypothetical protein L1987_14592 [Smallanthus sonchifolius]|uniref:Uncharacterized protein n=1 Tax=Smallanthus sonchifolius TaxID=185202 RepID=A0ACB9J3B7_9ASTR|nr:hypothetical protein L1987_14592 [Smallanthus sonchifolius]